MQTEPASDGARAGMTLREHPLRREIVREMHLRRWPPLSAPALVVQILRAASPSDHEREQTALAALPPGWELAPSDNGRHLSGTAGDGVHLVWERHSEATSITLFRFDPPAAAMRDLQADPVLVQALIWAVDLPGDVIRATRIVVLPSVAAAENMLPSLDFADSDLVSCLIGDAGGAEPEDRARIWSDFRIGPDGFGRLLIAVNGLTGGDLSRLIQRLQELGNYRNLALLGLPVAQTNWGALDQIERDLDALSKDVMLPDVSDERLLERAAALSLSLMAISTGASFRMSATAAYARLVEERLIDLQPQRIPGYPSLNDFTQRRFLPAVRTCASHVEREAQLSMRAHRFVSLLRARIETRIEDQNAQLLKSMESSAGLQLRLQQLVEGFSIFALSYYALGLVAHVLEGLAVIDPRLSKPWIPAVLTPIIVLGIWWTIHHFKRRVLDSQGHHRSTRP